MNANPSERSFLKESGFVTRHIAGETIIVPLRAGAGDLDSIYTLNDVGTLVWKSIDRRLTVREMAAEIAAEHDVDAETAAGDIVEFLRGLEDLGLIREAPGSP